jgi:hypothetical protein
MAGIFLAANGPGMAVAVGDASLGVVRRALVLVTVTGEPPYGFPPGPVGSISPVRITQRYPAHRHRPVTARSHAHASVINRLDRLDDLDMGRRGRARGWPRELARPAAVTVSDGSGLCSSTRPGAAQRASAP